MSVFFIIKYAQMLRLNCYIIAIFINGKPGCRAGTAFSPARLKINNMDAFHLTLSG